jgi:hypothetical protein
MGVLVGRAVIDVVPRAGQFEGMGAEQRKRPIATASIG